MQRRIDAGEILAALGGLLVVVSLFLSWFSDRSGWSSFETNDLLLALLGLAAIAVAVNAALDRVDGPPAATLPVIGGLLVFIVLVQLVNPPPLFTLAEADVGREIGAWLALLGSLLVLAGGILRVSRISLTLDVGGRDTRRRVPAVDRRAAAASAPPTQRPGGPVGTGPEGGASGIGAAIEEAEQHAQPEPAPVDEQHTQAFNALEAEEARDQP